MKNSNVRRMTTLALLIAILVVMSYTPLGFLQIGPLSLSLLTIPVAIAALVMGPVDGAIMGAVFGLTSFFNAMSGKSAMGTAMFTINPFGCFVVCVIARILMGYGCGLVYKLVHKALPTHEKTSCAIGGLSAALLNTLFFMGTLVLFFYNSDYVQGLVTALGVNNPLSFVIALVVFQVLIEAVVCCVVSAAVSVPLKKIWN
ncbi:MAG: ECF transporter S component [Erysipelotrichaceae bacterium]|nr:ECF transporter S component [Erysipelotrichaceae bacterium]